jgi:feruloyl esterase
LSWPFLTQSSSFDNVLDLLVYGKSESDELAIDIARAAQDIKRSLGPTINSDNPDLRTARRLGRKILQFHGWPDNAVLAQWSVDYFEAVQKFLGSDTQDFYRLFMVPGMAHCFGGVGPTALNGVIRFPLPNDPAHDWQSALEHWVEDGVAPEQMIATEFKQDGPPPLFDVAPPPPLASGTPIRRTRPLCPYPQVAVYKGTGSLDDAASFRCEAISGK